MQNGCVLVWKPMTEFWIRVIDYSSVLVLDLYFMFYCEFDFPLGFSAIGGGHGDWVS